MTKIRIDQGGEFLSSYIELPNGVRVEVGANTTYYLMSESQLLQVLRGDRDAKWLAAQLTAGVDGYCYLGPDTDDAV